MRALRIERKGDLSGLKEATVDKPLPGQGEVLVRVEAAAINPSDVKNVLGKMLQTTLPRTPGRDFAGVVEEGPAGLVGRPVFGTGGNLGFLRDGSHAEYLTVPVEAVIPRPDNLDAAESTSRILQWPRGVGFVERPTPWPLPGGRHCSG